MACWITFGARATGPPEQNTPRRRCPARCRPPVGRPVVGADWRGKWLSVSVRRARAQYDVSLVVSEVGATFDLRSPQIALSKGLISRWKRLHTKVAATMATGLIALSTIGVAIAHNSSDSSAVPPFTGSSESPVHSSDAVDSLNRSDLLASAPWLHQPQGSPRLDEVDALPSLTFPRGTTYDQAIEELYVVVMGQGSLPADRTLGPPLPKGIVFAHSGDNVALSLTAPFGYHIGTGSILLPSLAWSGEATEQEIAASVAEAARDGRVVPEGAQVVGNHLDPCQISTGDSDDRAC